MAAPRAIYFRNDRKHFIYSNFLNSHSAALITRFCSLKFASLLLCVGHRQPASTSTTIHHLFIYYYYFHDTLIINFAQILTYSKAIFDNRRLCVFLLHHGGAELSSGWQPSIVVNQKHQPSKYSSSAAAKFDCRKYLNAHTPHAYA